MSNNRQPLNPDAMRLDLPSGGLASYPSVEKWDDWIEFFFLSAIVHQKIVDDYARKQGMDFAVFFEIGVVHVKIILQSCFLEFMLINLS